MMQWVALGSELGENLPFKVVSLSRPSEGTYPLKWSLSLGLLKGSLLSLPEILMGREVVQMFSQTTSSQYNTAGINKQECVFVFV